MAFLSDGTYCNLFSILNFRNTLEDARYKCSNAKMNTFKIVLGRSLNNILKVMISFEK